MDLDDDLFLAAKAAAVRRRTTLKELVTRSLRRELAGETQSPLPPDSPYEINDLGLPSLKKQGAANPNAQLHKLLAEVDAEDVIAYLEGQSTQES